jgi:hypothetical protein
MQINEPRQDQTAPGVEHFGGQVMGHVPRHDSYVPVANTNVIASSPARGWVKQITARDQQVEGTVFPL